MDGKSFRDAYREVSKEIDSGEYNPGGGNSYTHIGSIGNPGLDLIKGKMESTLSKININAVDEIVENLSGYYKEKE
jgi:argininosuccinate lyase